MSKVNTFVWRSISVFQWMCCYILYKLKNECTFDEESLPFSKNIHHEERLFPQKKNLSPCATVLWSRNKVWLLQDNLLNPKQKGFHSDFHFRATGSATVNREAWTTCHFLYWMSCGCVLVKGTCSCSHVGGGPLV